MKKITTLLGYVFCIIMLVSLMIVSNAQKHEYKELESNFLKNSIGKSQKSITLNSFERKRIFQMHTNILKSVQTPTQRLDSIVTQKWEENQWIAHRKEDFNYNDKGNLTQHFMFDWSGTRWTLNSKEDYTYDTNGNVEESIYSNQWVPIRKEEYTYDVNMNMTQHLVSNWGPSHSNPVPQWNPYYKEEYTYDVNGNLIQYLVPLWYENQWVAGEKDTYTYDTLGNLIELIDFYWQEDSFKIIGKNDYTYDTKGNLIQITYSGWHESQWVRASKEEYTYNTNGDLTQLMNSYWRDSMEVAEWKVNYTYDSNGILTQVFDSHWDESEWIADGRSDCTYDDSHSFSDLLLPNIFYGFEALLFNHMLTNLVSYNWDETSNIWIKIRNDSLHYSGLISTTVSEINETEIRVYPNPATEFVSFTSSSNNDQFIFELFDLQGHKIMTKLITDNENISLQSISNGMYFYKLIINGKKHSGKLIKE